MRVCSWLGGVKICHVAQLVLAGGKSGEIGGEDKQMPAPLNWLPHTTTCYVEPVVDVMVVVVVVVVVAVAAHTRGHLVN